MNFSLEDEFDLDFNSDSLADDLENFVKKDEDKKAAKEEKVEDKKPVKKEKITKEEDVNGGDELEDKISNESSRLDSDSNWMTEDQGDLEDQENIYDDVDLDSFLDDKLNQIFSTETNNENNFEQTAQDSENDIPDDEVKLESVIDESIYAEIKYPCLLLNGASTNEEVEFLRSFSTEKSDSKAIYLYCEAEQGVCEIGYVSLTLKFLLTLSRMPGYRLYSLYSDNSERNEIKLDDPKVLSNFISL